MSATKVNEAAKKQVRQFFIQLTLIFIGFLASIVLFMVSSVVVVASADPKSHDLDTVMLISAPLSSMALILMANRLFAARLRPAKNAEKLYQKMDAYRGATLLRFMLLDGAAFLQLIAFFLTENRVFLLIAFVIATLFLLYRPSMDRFIRDMELSSLETRVMRDLDRKEA